MHGVWSWGSKAKRKTKEVVREDCQARKLNKEDAMDRCKWRKMIKDVRWSGWVWVGECFFWYRPTRVVPDQRPLNGCVCVYSYLLSPQHHSCWIDMGKSVVDVKVGKLWTTEQRHTIATDAQHNNDAGALNLAVLLNHTRKHICIQSNHQTTQKQASDLFSTPLDTSASFGWKYL